MKTRLNPWIVTTAALVLGLTAALTAPMAQATGNPNPRVLPPNSRPYGLTYTEWDVRWADWLFSIPSDQNPLGDPDGRFCQVGQSGPVFFLGSNFGGTSVRSCTVPAGKSLLFTPAGFIGLLTVDADTEEGLLNVGVTGVKKSTATDLVVQCSAWRGEAPVAPRGAD